MEQDQIENRNFEANSLIKHYEFWENVLNANNFVLNVIKSGYLIPFWIFQTR